MVTNTSYFHAVYAIAAVIYAGYIVSLIVRTRRARARLESATRRS
jgi:hypothetical protein